jgi:hypothetical protein
MDQLLSLVPYALLAWFSYHVGKHVATFTIIRNLVADPEGMAQLVRQLKEIDADDVPTDPLADAIEVETDEVAGVVYAYNKASGEFLAQAQTVHQAMLAASKRYPSKRFWHPNMRKDSQTA